MKRKSQEEPAAKKREITITPSPEEEGQARSRFQTHIFDPDYKESLKTQIKESQPYHWGTIRDLVDDELLRAVHKEITNEIVFTKKETDIYKVHQSGDLANLSGLDWDDLSRLPSLYKLRSAIYSQCFRDYISYVTGCGKLSGVKTDMSINTYNKSCHLLTHDDVIGSRRVSFILYLPEPGKVWKPHYGGALRLFDSLVPNVPKSDVHSKLVPQFNQIAFFKVQPGRSFHDVEEVRVDKQRLSIQGWFHIPQRGEDGFIPGEQEETEAKSTLQQLESRELYEYDFPKMTKSEISLDEIANYDLTTHPELSLSKEDVSYLSTFVNPALLTEESIGKLNERFVEESIIEVGYFLNKDLSELLRKKIKMFELYEKGGMPQNQEAVKWPWKLAVPSHKQRYLYMDGTREEDISDAESIRKVNTVLPKEQPNFQLVEKVSSDSDHVNADLCQLASMMRSTAFRKFLALVTGLIVIKDQVLVRRFRPGHDFILATKLEPSQVENVLDGILEATLNLTPSEGWESGEFGGYELCMATENEPEVVSTEDQPLNGDEAAIYKNDDNNESVLYESQACWNKFSLILRDTSVLKFVKYVSFGANGSRWDINGAWDLRE